MKLTTLPELAAVVLLPTPVEVLELVLAPAPVPLAPVLEAGVGAVEADVDEPCDAALEPDSPVLLEELEEAGVEPLPLPEAVLEPVVAPLPVALAPVGLVLFVAAPVPASPVDEPGAAVGAAFGSLGVELGAAGGSFCGEYMSGSRNSVIGIPRW
jgi:hypothetical protein